MRVRNGNNSRPAAVHVDEARPFPAGNPSLMRPSLVRAAILLSGAALPVTAELHRHHADQAPPPFVASTAKPFAALMDDAMAVMEDGMRRSPMTGDPDHDFTSMMIPHHQGAVDMAKALLLHTRDPELRNLALGIVTEQQNEIRLMRAWLARKHGEEAR